LLAEEALDGGSRLLAHIHLAGVQACDQVIGRQIDQLDVVGFVKHMVRQGLALADPSALEDQIVETLQVLHVEGGPDVDARGQQFRDVLPALGWRGEGSPPARLE